MNINGTAGNDTLNGTTGNDSILAFGGDDFVNAGAGNDTVEYGAGNDTVFGGDGDDVIDDQGGAGFFNGNNLIFAGAGNDTVFDSSGNDTVFGEAGNDLLLMDSGGNDSVEGGDGNDTIDGGSGNDTLNGGAGSDSLIGGDGADVFILDQTTGLDTIAGGAGGTDLDRINLAPNPAASGVTVTLTGAEAGTVTVNGGTQIASFTDVEQFTLTASNDTFNGAASTTAPVTVDGGAGNDTLTGTGASDSLIGGLGNDSVFGGLGADTISGGDGVDSIFGGAGNDSLSGDAGSDIIEYGAGNDTVFGGDGDDFIDDQGGGGFANGDNQLFGGAGNDTIWDSSGNDTVFGGDGNDFLGMDSGGNDSVDGGLGNDTIDGGTGNDTLTGGAGADSLIGGDGADVFILDQTTGLDTVFGGAGGTDTDRVDLSTNPAATGVTVALNGNEAGTITVNGGAQIASFSDIEQFTLTAGNDVLTGADSLTAAVNVDGGAGNDSLRGTGAADTLLGGVGNDSLDGGAGNDSIDGGADNDSLTGGAGNDTLLGGAGNDTLTGGAGADSLDGGDGADIFLLDQTTGVDIVAGGAGGTDTDRVDLSTNPATTGVTVALTGNEAGTITVNGGAQIANFTDIEQFTLTAGNDVLAGADSQTAAVNVDGGVGNDSLRGTGAADTLLGGAGNDSLDGGAGNDSIDGGADNDSLTGGAGNDTLLGGAGNDTLNGGAGADSLDGGDGADIFLLDQTTGLDTVAGGAGGTDRDRVDLSTNPATTGVTVALTGNEAGTITVNGGAQIANFTDIEQFTLTAGNDVLTGADSLTAAVNVDGGAGNDSLRGTGAADTLLGGVGNDSLDGGAGNDSIDGGADNDSLTGGAGNDTLLGGAGNDTLNGGAGADSLEGGAGNDSLSGGLGDDALVGGDGADTVVGGSGNDTLDGGAGDDVIAASGVDLVFGGAGDDLFTLDIAGLGLSDAITIVGGETGEDLSDPTNGGAGDVLDLSLSLEPVSVSFGANGESGSVDGIDVDLGPDITFSEIEKVITTDLADTIFGGSATGSINVDVGGGNDTVTTGSGNDAITAGAGDDTVAAGAGNDSVFGGDGNDTLAGGDGNDSLSGGTGDDVITSGSGNDTLGGGAGQDRFVLQDGGGTDRIIDFNLTRINGLATDWLDVSGLTDAGGNPLNWRDVVVTDTVGDGSGDAILTFPNGQTIILAGIAPAAVTGQVNLVALGIPCFASGTPIRTPQGWRPVETLVKGDLVHTLDHGLQPVLWCGARMTTREEMDEKPMLLPIKLRAGALGNGSDIKLSAQHAILMQLDGEEVMVRAIHLARAGFRGVRVAQGTRQVCYHHLLLPNHGILESDGLLSESFYPGPIALSMLSAAHRVEMAAMICRARPQRQTKRAFALNEVYGPPARRVLTGKEAAAAIARDALRPVQVPQDWPCAVQVRPAGRLRLVHGF